MTRKTPSVGTTTVEVHTRPTPATNPDTPQRDSLPPRANFDSANPRNTTRTNGTPENADLDAIMPASTITVSPIGNSAVKASTPLTRPLKRYWIDSATKLPAADAQGLRTFKERQYADVPGGGTVHIHMDPDTGLYRAKLASELQPSGPVLGWDSVSKLWHTLDDFESITFPLSSTRLEAFRTPLDFSGVAPDGNGLHRHDGKLYAVIESHAYQVVHDTDATSPQISVMRIVRAEDPVAQDADNLYAGTRPGASEPIFFHAQTGWIGLVVGGAGGMWPRQNRSERSSLAERLSTLAGLMSAPRDRVRTLFPSFDHEQVTTYLHSLGDDVASGLTRQESEYATLKQELKSWSEANTKSTTDFSTQWAKGISKEILRCWRRETGTTLTLTHHGETLPAVQAGFGHVQTLELKSVNWTAAADTFLSGFSGLNRLTIVQSRLEKIPAAIKDMQHLTALDLQSNRIVLDEQSALQLSTLSQLEHIDLSGNGLGMTPDFSGMSGLKVLNLSNTGIAQWPAGLHTQGRLEVVDLRNNLLQEVPQAHLNPADTQLETIARINNVTLLQGNPFPADYWQHFDRYWEHLNLHRPDLMASAKADAFYCTNPSVDRWRRLFPDKTLHDARHFLHEAGTEAEAKLVRLERELNTLEEQLSAWSFSGGGTRSGYVRANQIQMGHDVLADRYEARNRIFKCWRQETPQQFANDGTPIGLELDLSGLSLPTLPDLDVDFSHVGSLKLNRMNLSTTPEGFLSRFRHVRWLDLSNNQLRELPPAIGEMHGMTRLFLQKNQIVLTPETARILSERVTLRALILNENPLGIAPDFSRITDMRSLQLSNTNLETWPTGLVEQPLLDTVLLRNNRITTIPDSVIAPPDARLAQTARINNATDVTDNPLSDATRERIRQYGDRLVTAGITTTRNPNNLVRTARTTNWVTLQDRAGEPFQRWAIGLSDVQISAKKAQWQALNEQEGAAPFFEILKRLDTAGAGYTDLQRRVWEVLDSISENNPGSETLRRQMFDRAGEPACCDRAAFSFSNLEVMSMVYKARRLATDQTQGLHLSTLSRGMFRLHEVDKFAAADIQRSEAILKDPNVSEAQKRPHRQRLNEEIEIRLAYRFGLKDRLQLPGQPQQVTFIGMGAVTPDMLDAAYTKIIALDNSPEERQALLSREFWQDYVTNKYRPQFEAQSKPYHERLATLHERLVAKQMTEAAYKAQSDDLQAQLAIEEAALMLTLTQQELAAPLTASEVTALPD